MRKADELYAAGGTVSGEIIVNPHRFVSTDGKVMVCSKCLGVLDEPIDVERLNAQQATAAYHLIDPEEAHKPCPSS